ncbi:hypothetical protein [Microlunatus flavus]|uniref:Uncharacterized protein n=1 Tax=Microlunatus flavus TaxID=1036181 RepID=A0A1H9MG63_9ACTN|nr:hypothetical protein [Microlunatus flavus]SER22489.1 hypothetical protein SAMN05421756_110111 [Microlunatus flavus]
MLAVYLRNHEAAAQGGAELFRRMASSQRRRPWGPELEDLTADVVEDLRSLRALLRGWRVSPDPWAGLTVKLGERVGRLKPNGHLVSRSPLSDLVEVEAGLDAVHAKAAGWQALLAAPTPTPSVDLDDLARRAEDQVARLRAVHVQVAAAVL